MRPVTEDLMANLEKSLADAIGKTRQPKAATIPVSEADLQTLVVDAARTYGWKCAHFRAAQTARGWRTPVEADGAGFPDLVLVRPPRVLFVELKSAKGRLSIEQQLWLSTLVACPDIEVYIWRPDDIDQLLAILKGGPAVSKDSKQNVEDGQTQAGWGVIRPGDRKSHYYDGMTSLCGRVGSYFGPKDDDGTRSPDDCAACRKKLDRAAQSGRDAEPQQ